MSKRRQKRQARRHGKQGVKDHGRRTLAEACNDEPYTSPPRMLRLAPGILLSVRRPEPVVALAEPWYLERVPGD